VRGEPAVLGIDLGTSRLKALLCTRDGHVLGRGVAGYEVRTPGEGRAETDPEEWWRAAAVAVRHALHEAEEKAAPPAQDPPRAKAKGESKARAEAEPDAGPTNMAGLAVTGQMHGLVLAGEQGEPVRPAILWLDRRAVAEAAEYRRLPERLLGPLGNPPSPGMAGPMLLWLSRHEPEACRRARWMLQPKDWLRLRLTGNAATEPTDASGTLLFDIDRDQWATELAQALGIPQDPLPPVRQPGEIAGRLSAEAAAHLGLASGAGLAVAVGAADTAASLLAAGLPGTGWGMLTLGTGGQWVVPVATRTADPTGRTNLFRAVAGYQAAASLYRLAAVQNVGAALDWARTTLGATWDDLYATAERPWRNDTPVFLPYLAGERWDHAEGGAWTGLSLAHHREDLLRAALEGVAFLLRERLEDLGKIGSAPGSVLLGGGGSQHRAWRQLLADVLRRPLYPAATPWLTPRGATLIAAVATGLLPGWEATVRSVPSSAEAQAPAVSDAAGAEAAEASYARFREASRE
jgi:xylulokinase